MLIGGRLRRAEAGRGRPLHDDAGTVVGFSTAASGADLADAVAAARAALPGWSGISAHERGRLLFAVAEVLDERRDRLATDAAVPADDVGTAVDRWLWYAGWTDKLAGVLGAVHPVAGPYASWSTPQPVGVVGVLGPAALLGLVDGLASVLAAGATAVVVAPHDPPRAVLATAELPAGAANLLTGDVAELAPELARAVDGLDLAGAPGESAARLGRDAAARGVRVLPVAPADPLARLRAWTDVTTVWQSVGR
jgi:acyl-CoA reductase-like NAD-dependent aldehyde dehydrogenase